MGCLSLPAIIGWERNSASATRELENRNQAAAPPVKLLRKSPPEYIKAMDAYLKDTVGFRLEANTLYRKLRFFVFRDPTLPNVTLGQDGHAFFNSPKIQVPNYYFQTLCLEQGKPLPGLLHAVDTTLAHTTAFFERHGAVTIAAIVPSTIALYPEKLPLRLDSRYRKACLAYPGSNHLLAQLQRIGAQDGRYRIFYPLALFNEHKNEAGFYPKERYHWAGKSAYLFARHLAMDSGAVQTLRLDDPVVPALVEDDLRSFYGFYRPIQGFSYPYHDQPTEEASNSWVTQYSAKGSVLQFRTRNSLSPKKALLISNSFGAMLAPHLARCFGELHHLSTNTIHPGEQAALFAALAERIRPDYVFLVYDDVNVVSIPKWLAGFVELEQQTRQMDLSSRKESGLEKCGP